MNSSPLLLPEPLQSGDTIAIIAPAGVPKNWDDFETGVRVLREMGFNPKWPRERWPGTGFLADRDTNRAAEIHAMLADPEVKGLIALRGGYGCLRLLPYLDFSLFRQFPKMILGFSDITILLNHIATQSHLVCFHGPVVTTLGSSDRLTLELVTKTLTGNWKPATLDIPGLEILRKGSATGKLLGGNLTTLVSLVGTPYDCDWHDSILFLEDIHEPLYRIDRMLTQLFHSGKVQQLRGILLGNFTLTSDADLLAKLRYTEAIWMRVHELTQKSGIPVWGNLPSGHCAQNLPLPIGATVSMDSNTKYLSIY